MSSYVAEMIGTALLIFLGDSCIAAVLLNKSKAQSGGWLVITIGWGLALAFSIYAVAGYSGGHLNPAVTIALAAIGKFPWSKVPLYILAQFIGAFIGAALVWLHYLPHWAVTEDKGAKLAVFCTGPAIRSTGANLISEILGTFVLVLGVLVIVNSKLDPGMAPLLIGLLLVSIGHSLGPTTGYAINPARDLGPRIAHFVLPIAGKGDSDWGYAWIPVVGPVIGGVIGAVFYVSLF